MGMLKYLSRYSTLGNSKIDYLMERDLLQATICHFYTKTYINLCSEKPLKISIYSRLTLKQLGHVVWTIMLFLKLNKTFAFYILKIVLVVTFVYFFGNGIRKLIKNEIGTKIVIEKGSLISPSFNICPFQEDSGQLFI